MSQNPQHICSWLYDMYHAWRMGKIKYEPDKNIYVAHADRVWFYVVSQKWANSNYSLYIYGNISQTYIETLKRLYYKPLQRKIKVSFHTFIWSYCVINIHEDIDLPVYSFLEYVPIYKELNNIYIQWPYLDNLISRLSLEIIGTQWPHLSIFNSIDEEVYMTYTKYPDHKSFIVLDTIRPECIDFSLQDWYIYNIISTEYNNFACISHPSIIQKHLSISFKLECDIILDKYPDASVLFLLCPIYNWHQHDSYMAISTINSLLSIIYNIQNNTTSIVHKKGINPINPTIGLVTQQHMHLNEINQTYNQYINNALEFQKISINKNILLKDIKSIQWDIKTYTNNHYYKKDKKDNNYIYLDNISFAKRIKKGFFIDISYQEWFYYGISIQDLCILLGFLQL
jgi:hypothetical protein